MVRFALVALCVTATLSGARAATPLEFGMDMSNQAYKLVCWFENLKNFPKARLNGFGECENGGDHIIKELDMPGNQDYYKMYPEKKEAWFGDRMPSIMDKLPSEYKTCEKYLSDRKATPATDESDALNDGGNDYPYKGFAYCMMQTLRDKNGEEAIEAVKSEKTHSRQHWMTLLLKRENEYRARHGVEPLQLATDLMKGAQEWADTNAKKCEMFHSDDDYRKWNGESVGENLASGGGGDEGDIAAYQAANSWYNEIQYYPFPEGYTKNDDALFHKIGHFTQTVWKGTKYVGYGYGFNEKCGDKGIRYIAARYYPAGNMMGEYPKNVNPPKDK